MWNAIKGNNLYLMGISEEETEWLYGEMVAENFPNLGKEIVNQVQKTQSPRRDKPKEEHTKTQSNQTYKNQIQR